MKKACKPVGRAALKAALANLPKKAKKNKFGAVKTVVDGITFHSKGEAARYQELKLLEKAGKISLLRLQCHYPLMVPQNGGYQTVQVGTYIADFVYDADPIPAIPSSVGRLVVEDFKGHRTPEYRLKKKLFEALYYPITITETGKSSRHLTRRKRSSK